MLQNYWYYLKWYLAKILPIIHFCGTHTFAIILGGPLLLRISPGSPLAASQEAAVNFFFPHINLWVKDTF